MANQPDPQLSMESDEVPPKLEEVPAPGFVRGELDVPAERAPGLTPTSPVPDSQAEHPVDAVVATSQLPVSGQMDPVEMATLHMHVAPRGPTYTGGDFHSARSSPQRADDLSASQQALEPPEVADPARAEEGDTMLDVAADLVQLNVSADSGAEPGYGFRRTEEA